jgi:hypothetical protein
MVTDTVEASWPETGDRILVIFKGSVEAYAFRFDSGNLYDDVAYYKLKPGDLWMLMPTRDSIQESEDWNKLKSFDYLRVQGWGGRYLPGDGVKVVNHMGIEFTAEHPDRNDASIIESSASTRAFIDRAIRENRV